MDDQQQQSSKSKRSSILKPAKQRNPLVDVDIKYPPVPIETTFMRSRRVSFASNNFIKEFTTDPEKNTIWHVSYEEANRSDHSAPQTSSDNNDDASDDFNCTKIGEIDMSMVSPLDSSPIVYTNNIVSTKNFPVVLKDTNIIRQTVNYIQDNMELTCNHLNSEKPTEKLDMSLEIENPEVMFDSNKTIHFNQESNTGLMAMSETIPRFNMETHENLGTNRQTIHCNNDETIGGEIEVTEKLTNFINPANISKVTQQAFNFSHLKNRNIEVTKTIYGFVNLGNKDYHHPERQPIHFTHETTLNDVQLPQLIPNTKRQTFFFNQESNSGDLEITQSIPTHIIRSKNEIIHYDTKPTTNKTEINLTHNAFVNSKDIQSSKRQTIHYNPESNPDYMDIIQAIPDQNELIHTEEISNSKQLTTHFNHETMNMTETIPTHTKFVEKINTLGSKRQTIHYNQESNTAHMDMTEAIPDLSKVLNKENIPSTKRLTIHFNQESNPDTMDMTETIPAHIKFPNNYNICTSNRQTINYNQELNPGRMDMTQIKQNELLNKENIPSTKRLTIYFNQESNPDTMDMTETIPAHIKFPNNYNISTSNRQTINYNQELNPDRMDMTQIKQNELLNKENIPSTKRLTIHFNQESNPDTMDMTETIPAHIKFPNNYNICTSNRQTINYNQELNPDRMDMTQIKQNELLNKENIPSTKRLTIHFNQESNPDTMDITETIPAHIKFPNNYNICTSNRQTINYNQELNPDTMDMTQIKQIELLNKENIPSSKRLTTYFNQESNPGTMDMTKIMPDPVKLSPNQSVIQYSQKSNIGIDFKQQTLISNNQELYMGDMEFTQAIPSINNLQINIPSNNNVINKEINKRQSIIYHQESNVGNMEMTQSIPNHINLEKDLPSYSNVVNNENNPSTKRKTVLYNQESDMGIMECTRVISKDDLMLNINNKSINCEEIKLNQLSDSNNKPNICAPMSINQNSPHDLTPVITAEPEVFAKYQNNEFKMSETDLLDSTQFTSEPPISSTRIENNLSTDYNIKNNPKIVPSISNDSDICQRIKFPGETFDMSKMQLEKLNFTPAPSNLSHKSLNTINLSTDNTEKLINFQIGGNPMSEYSKIINDDVNLPSLLCMTGGNCFNVSENVDAKFNHTEFHSLILGTCKDIEDAPKNVNNIEPSPNNGEIQNELQDNCKLAGEDCARNIYIPIPDPNLNLKLQDENCVRNIEDYNAITNSNCKPAEIKPMDDKQIVNKRTSIERMGSVSSKKCNTSKSDSFILVDSSSESDSCYEVDVTNKTIKDKVTSNERTFNEILEKSDMILPENVSLVESFNSNNSNTDFAAVSFHAKEVERHINEAYITKNQQPNSENLMLKRAILKKLLDSLDEPNQKHENVPIEMIANENTCITSNEKSKVDILRERFEKIKNYKAPNITENIPVKELTLEDKIKGKCNDAMWSIISMNNEEFQFFFMYETIKFIVNIDRVSEIVKNVAVFTQFCKLTSDPSAIYVHSILDKKLSQAHLKSAFGQKYTILSFLDYITITEEQMRDIFNEFEDLALRYALIIDREMNATYKAVNSYLRIAFEVTFNLSDLDHITEECVSVKQIIGSVRQAEVKRLVKSCPQGIAFIRTFIMTAEEYLKKLENVNKSRKCIQSAT